MENKETLKTEEKIEGKTKKVDTPSKKAKSLFATYPSIKELHFTSDGLAFESKNSAFIHAKTLENGKIETIKRK